jgi:hypothetical protein
MARLIIWLVSLPLLWAVLGLVLGPFFFLRGFRLLQRKRLIMDIPRSTVRAAALGSLEISGRAAGPYTLVAPLTHTDCLFYRIVSQTGSKGNRSKLRELCAPLYVDDGTGTLLIYPEGAELQVPASSDLTDYDQNAIANTSGYSSGDPELFREYSIKPGDQIFVLGTLQENLWAKRDPRAESSELSRIGPGFVSADEADILRHEAFPLLDPSLPSGVAVASPDEFDFHPPVILMKGHGPFVISTHSQREIVTTLNWKSILYIWGGPIAALWGLWEILRQARAAGLLPGNF